MKNPMTQLRITGILAITMMATPMISQAGWASSVTKHRATHRAKALQYFNKVQRVYEQAEKKLNSAKYLDDMPHARVQKFWKHQSRALR